MSIPLRAKVTDLRITVEDNNSQRVLRYLTGPQLQSVVKQIFAQQHSQGMKYMSVVPQDYNIYGGLDGDSRYIFFNGFMAGVFPIFFDWNRDYTMLYNTVGVNYPKLKIDLGDVPVNTDFPDADYAVEREAIKAHLITRQVITPAVPTP